MNFRRLYTAAASAVLLATPVVGGAATTSDTMTVTSTVEASCALSTTDLAFGIYDPVSSTANDATTTIDAACTDGTTFDVTLDGGSSAKIQARTMSDGSTNTMSYQIYLDSGRTTIWGDTSKGSPNSGTGTGTQTPVTFTAFGRIPAQQNLPAGSYSDTVNVTLTF